MDHSQPKRGPGRPPKSTTGEPMRTRQIRMTDAEWEDAKLVGSDALRKWVRQQAAKLRRHPSSGA